MLCNKKNIFLKLLQKKKLQILFSQKYNFFLQNKCSKTFERSSFSLILVYFDSWIRFHIGCQKMEWPNGQERRQEQLHERQHEQRHERLQLEGLEGPLGEIFEVERF